MATLDKIQFNNLLIQAVEQGASDIFLSMGSVPILKIGGQLIPVGEDILTAVKIEELIFPLVTVEQKENLIKNRSLVFGYTFENNLRFKVSLFYQKGSLSASLRIIPNKVKTINEIGLPPQIEKIFDFKSGLVIISGPINSGKSTTLSAFVDYFNSSREARIVTLEEPIEFIFENKKCIIQQREIGKDTPSFKAGLADCLETSLDIVVVGQVEGRDEVERILELTQQGRLVIVNISANSVLEVILKLLTYFDKEEHGNMRNILSRDLKAIVCQKLVLNKDKGLTMVPEILFNSDAVRLSIQDNKLDQINNILRTSGEQGMITFEQALAQFARAGEILPDEAIKNAKNPDEFKQIISDASEN